MHLIPRCLAAAACCLTLALTGCDRDVTDPGADSDDVEALLARAGLAPAGSELTLPALLRDAIRTVQREQGTEAARLQLERLRSLRSPAPTTDAPADSIQPQLRLVLDILGGGTLNRALRATTDRLHILDAAVDSARGDTAPLRGLQASARGELEAAGTALAGGDSIAALGHSAAAAEHAASLRRALLDRRRVQSLPELFARTRVRLDTVAGIGAAEMLARHESLSAAAREAVTRGGRSEAYRALTALRNEEVRLTIGVLGEGVAEKVVRDVAVALDELRPQLGGNVKLQRMHRAAHDLQVRAAAELERGRPDSALDLGSHAASLANALRLVATLR